MYNERAVTEKETTEAQAGSRRPERRLALWAMAKQDDLGIVGNLEMLARSFREGKWSCRLALVIAAVWAGIVPIGVYVLTHIEGVHILDAAFKSWMPRHYVVTGGLIFSASSVWTWGRTFYNGVKSACWVMLLEGCMIFSATGWLQVFVLVLIVFTNMMAASSRAAQKEKLRQAAAAPGAAPEAEAANARALAAESALERTKRALQAELMELRSKTDEAVQDALARAVAAEAQVQAMQAAATKPVPARKARVAPPPVGTLPIEAVRVALPRTR